MLEALSSPQLSISPGPVVIVSLLNVSRPNSNFSYDVPPVKVSAPLSCQFERNEDILLREDLVKTLKSQHPFAQKTTVCVVAGELFFRLQRRGTGSFQNRPGAPIHSSHTLHARVITPQNKTRKL